MISVPRHGPYRAVLTLAGTSSASTTALFTCEFVPPDRDHCTIGPAGDGIESITIGQKTWTRQGKGAWEPGTDGSATPAQTTPSAADLVRAVEQPSKNPKLRRFAVVIKDTPKNSPGTVTVDRQGRLRSFSMVGPQGRATFAFTDDARIRITAPA
jgi:hypothetical protein